MGGRIWPCSPPCAKAPAQPQLHQHSQEFSCWAPRLTHKSGMLDPGLKRGEVLLAAGDSLGMTSGQGFLLQHLLQAGDRAGSPVTCPGSASAKDEGPTASLCPVPAFIPVSCHPTPRLPPNPYGPSEPSECLWSIAPHLFSHKEQAQLLGANSSPGGPLLLLPSALRSRLSASSACSHSSPPLIPQNREPSRAPEPGLVPQVNLGQTHSCLPLHQPTPFCPCKLPLLHTPLPLILILPLGNFHFSSPC